MMGRKYAVWIIPALLSLSPWAHAQEINRCLTTEYENLRQSKSPRRETPAQFEQWIQSRVTNRLKNNGATLASVYTIPVVVHVIHNGINDLTNISDAQVFSQIDVLNKDYNRVNLDAVNTPAEFVPVAGSISIQFVLAKRDPEGRATNGIVRVQGTKAQWSLADQSEFKALSYWPAEDYLNIWVINFGTNDLGFAQFPVSNTLAGLESASADRLTDGIVVDYQAFGTSDAGSFPLQSGFNKGRTATHEIGHFFGLRHIWGDGNDCSATDYVDDTPPQSSLTSGCPAYPTASCTPSKMFMNYMDYTQDACMNLFTVGQFARAQVILNESPRRASLLTSLGATPPVVVTNDLGIKRIVSPGTAACGSQVIPSVEVRNYGTNAITSAQVSLSVNGSAVETRNLTVSLQPQETSTISFSAHAVPSPGSTFEVSFHVEQTNGGVDGNSQNDSDTQSVTVPQQTTLPVSETFNTLPSTWSVLNPDNQITWTNVVAPDVSPTNRGMRMDFYNYDDEGVLDWMLTPSFALSSPENAQLKFDVAYAQFPGLSADVLSVYALPACDRDLSKAILLYSKSGTDLATVSSTNNPFLPANTTQWRKPETISLLLLNAAIPWQIAFVAQNGYGNNLYLDNVLISQTEISDIAFAGVVSPGIVHCQPSPVVRFRVTNLGTSTVTSFKLDYTVNNGTPATQLFTSLKLDVGETETYSLNAIALQPGPNEITLTLSLPNGIPDIPTNNTYHLMSVLDQTVDRAPLRKTFDNPLEKNWRVASPISSLDWEAVKTNKETSLSYRSFTNPTLGQESWLVSPVLDLTAGDFTLFFDVSYAQNSPADDRLKILASTDCGVTYDQVIMDRPASDFKAKNSSAAWSPATEDDWKLRQYANISAVAGLNQVRIAFVASNDNGNNLYLDNIQFFSGDDPNPPITTAKYQFYYSDLNSKADIALTLNLDQRQDVPLQIITLQGTVIAEYTLTDALNQTYYFNLANQAAGLYLFRMIVDDKPTVTKVFIGQ